MSGNVNCPECGKSIQEKNVRSHFLRFHPGIDPYEKFKENRVEKITRAPRPDIWGSPVAFVLFTIAVVILLISGYFLYRSLDDGPEEIGPRTVFYTSEDGAIINATWYDTGEEGSPTVYLVHEIGQTREVWEEFAGNLRNKGYNVMAMDLRGHGESHLNVKDPDIYYDFETMEDQDFLDIFYDLIGAYNWVHKDDLDGEPNTQAGEDGAMVGIGKGGLLAFRKATRMSRERIVSAVILSPVLVCYGMDVPQAFEEWGDVRPIMASCGSLDQTSLLAVEEIERRTPEKGVQVVIEGTDRGLDLLEHSDVRESIYRAIDDGFSL
ncbi:MAG: alpha/beta hydrolase [Thermoplasmata archaeon]|nr:alpha/beta hydrolase [Thermoplasmata archaeon]